MKSCFIKPVQLTVYFRSNERFNHVKPRDWFKTIRKIVGQIETGTVIMPDGQFKFLNLDHNWEPLEQIKGGEMPNRYRKLLGSHHVCRYNYVSHMRNTAEIWCAFAKGVCHD